MCGPGGEWIGERYGDERIKYLGVTPTIEYLFGVVKSCDVGIIPYPRQTYNDIEYPTKLALYITCEVPVLTNNLPTCSSVVLENNVGMSCSLEHMSSSMALLARNDELRAMFKENCRRVKEHFYWDRIFDDAFAPIIHKQPRYRG